MQANSVTFAGQYDNFQKAYYLFIFSHPLNIVVPNAPPLRFPEFSGEWEKVKIADYGNVITGNTPSTSHTEYYGGNRLWASPADLGAVKMITHTAKELSGIGFAKTRALPEGSVLVTCIGSTIGKMGMASCEMSTNQQINSVVVGKGFDNEFVYYNIMSSFPKYIKEIATQAVPILSKSSFERLPTWTTSIEEQKKIGKLLSLIDERIATQIGLINKLQSLISGIIQHTVKDGLAKQTWKKVVLSTVLAEHKELNTNLYSVYSVSVSEGVVNQVEYLGRSFASKDTSHYHVVKFGDIVYTKSPTGDFPFGIVKQSMVSTPAAVSPLYGVYKPITVDIGLFLHYYFMSSVNANNYLQPLIQKGAKNTINIGNQRFLENVVPLPISIEEIKSLSETLKTMQQKIDLERLVLIELRKQHMFLLSNMFI